MEKGPQLRLFSPHNILFDVLLIFPLFCFPFCLLNLEKQPPKVFVLPNSCHSVLRYLSSF